MTQQVQHIGHRNFVNVSNDDEIVGVRPLKSAQHRVALIVFQHPRVSIVGQVIHDYVLDLMQEPRKSRLVLTGREVERLGLIGVRSGRLDNDKAMHSPVELR